MADVKVGITYEDFMNYENLRLEGRVNMADVKSVILMTGLPKEKVERIMNEYDLLYRELISDEESEEHEGEEVDDSDCVNDEMDQIADLDLKTEEGFEEYLMILLRNHGYGVSDVCSFDHAGLLTMNSGVVVDLDCGVQFQLQIIRSA